MLIVDSSESHIEASSLGWLPAGVAARGFFVVGGARVDRKTFEAAQFKAIDGDQGIAEMIVSVFHNTDGGNEIVMPGFFAESIARRRTMDGRPKAKGVWSHEWGVPIGKTLDAKELLPGDGRLPPSLADLGGLWVQGQFNLETQRGREAFSDLKFGAIDEFSIGYSVTRDEYDNETGVRKLLKGEWYEWSPVLVGMNDATVLLGTKAATPEPPPDPDNPEWLAKLAAWLAEVKEGRAISAARRGRLEQLRDQLQAGATDLEGLLTETAPKDDGKAGRQEAGRQLMGALLRWEAEQVLV